MNSANRLYITREEAIQLLHVKRKTLYSYVSRGLIRRVPEGRRGQSLYLREDVEMLRSRSLARSGHGPAAAAAMNWGEPVLSSAITHIDSTAGPFYRGAPAIELARDRVSFEDVFRRLCATQNTMVCDASGASTFYPTIAGGVGPNKCVTFTQYLAMTASSWTGFERVRLQNAAPALAYPSVGWALIRHLAGAFGILGPEKQASALAPTESVAEGIVRRLALPSEQINTINGCLVLSADHELNPATFTARIAISNGASLPSALAAALHVQDGLARDCDELEEKFRTLSHPNELLAAARSASATGGELPGFNHRLYPGGDPRARYVIDCAREQSVLGDRSAILDLALAQLETFQNMKPGLKTGLAYAATVLDWPAGMAGALFSLGRSAGWIAHALEQRNSGSVIRPRANFLA